VLRIEGCAVNIPLTDGKALHIPANSIFYNPASNQLNISEEVSKTGIWKQLSSEAGYKLTPPTPLSHCKKDVDLINSRYSSVLISSNRIIAFIILLNPCNTGIVFVVIYINTTRTHHDTNSQAHGHVRLHSTRYCKHIEGCVPQSRHIRLFGILEQFADTLFIGFLKIW